MPLNWSRPIEDLNNLPPEEVAELEEWLDSLEEERLEWLNSLEAGR